MINSTVKAVRFYRSGFSVEAEGMMKLEKGRQTIRMGNLVSRADSSTIRLFLPEGIYGTNVQLRELTEQEKKPLTREIEDKIRKVTEKIGIYEKMNEVWINNADFSNRDNITSMAEYMDKLPERLEQTAEKIDELNKELENLNKELADKKKEIARPFITVEVESENEGEYPFRLNYFVNNAYWQPEYELHADEENNEVTVRLKGRICQNSDSDLKDVRVTLCTGNPGLSGTIPSLYPRYVSFYEPARYMGGAARKTSMMMGMMVQESAMADEEVMDAAEEPEYEEVFSNSASVNYGDTMVEYELNGTWDIRKDEDFMCDISSSKISCRYHIVSVPLMDESAYLAAEVNTTDIEDLIDTEAAIYQNGAFMGKSYLAVNLNKEKYDLSLGRDENIRVKRKEVRKHTSNMLLRAQKKVEHEYEITVKSTKPKKCEVTVLDQIPVSQDKSITVDKREISGASFDEKTGQLKWDFSIEPGENRTLKMAYDLTWPKDKQISV